MWEAKGFNDDGSPPTDKSYYDQSTPAFGFKPTLKEMEQMSEAR